MSRAHIDKLSGWLFSRVLASHAGGPGSIPGRDMSVLGPLVRMKMTLVKSPYHNIKISNFFKLGELHFLPIISVSLVQMLYFLSVIK